VFNTFIEGVKGGHIIKGLRIPPEGISLEKVEEALIREALITSCGNQTRAAKLLDISRDSLRYRMHKFGIEAVRSPLLRETWAQQNGKETAVFHEMDHRPLPEEGEVSRNRRRFKRIPANFPACIGDARSKTGDFTIGTIQDISMGGSRLSVPKGTNLITGPGCEDVEFSISFSLPNHHWPIGVKCLPRRVVELNDEIQIGAMFVDTDIRSHHALQQYMNCQMVIGLRENRYKIGKGCILAMKGAFVPPSSVISDGLDPYVFSKDIAS
jgi:hypothetical protein